MMTATSLLCESCIHRFVCKFSIHKPTFCSHHIYGTSNDSITFTKQGNENEQTIYPKYWSYGPKKSKS